MTGRGSGRTQADGKFTGPHYQKLPRHVVNSSSVGVRRGAAKEGANVPRHHFSALPFATAVDHVLRTSKHLDRYTCIMVFFPECYFSSC